MKYLVECDSCNTLKRVSGDLLSSSFHAIPRGWYQFVGPLPRVSGVAGNETKDICGDCAVGIINDRMSASEDEETDEDSG